MHIQELKLVCKVKALWVKGCEHDGIDYNNLFVVWSVDNPFSDSYNQAINDLTSFKHGYMLERIGK